MVQLLRPQIHFNQVIPAAQKRKKEIIKIIGKIIDSGTFLDGIQNRKLEKNIRGFLGCGWVTTTASGHDALTLALSALNLTQKDEVIFPVNVYPTAFPVCLSGAKPVPVDVDRNGQLGPERLKEKINKRTKVVVVVHLYGLVGKIDEIRNLVKDKGIFLVEDCAQAFGSTFAGRPVGTFGDIACFSFYPTKNLSTLGDGGALWTRHKKFHDFFLKAKSYGENNRYRSEFLSGHSRLPEIQAGILTLYFKNIQSDFQKRKHLAQYYRKKLKEEGLDNFIRMFESHPKSNPILHLFVVEADKRDSLQKYLGARNIPALIHYPYPIHLVPAFSFLNYKRGDFPTAEKLSKTILSLPFHPRLLKADMDYVAKTMKAFFKNSR